MKNLSIDLNLEFFNVDNFSIHTFPQYKESLKNLVKNFHKKSNHYIGRNKIFLYNNLVIRKYYHGGLLRHILRDNFTEINRFLNELGIIHYLNRRNFPTVKAIGVLVKKNFFYKAYIVTENIAGSIDLINVLLKDGSFDLEYLFYNAGKITKNLHSYNIIHKDLHIKNFLIKNKDIFLIDFDKSFFSENKEEKIKDIRRLIRSCYKFNYFSKSKKIEEHHISLFLDGYGEDKEIISDVKINWLNKISWHLNKPKYL